MTSAKKIIKSLLPSPIIKALQKYRTNKTRKEYCNLTTQQIFTKIYEEGVWGKSEDPSQKFFSGAGSHEGLIVSAYIEAIQNFLSTFEKKPNVVDLGCGDFFIGSNIRSLCANYTACDIVEPLVNFNREKFKSLDVVFKVLDFTKDELPQGEIVFIRQVLQHLSNEQIQNALPQIALKYKYLVLTEHLPGSGEFTHNLDKPTGPDLRLYINSGIVLTSAPFNLKVKEQKQLCQVAEYGGIITSTLYTL